MKEERLKKWYNPDSTQSEPLTEQELEEILNDPAVIEKTADNIMIKVFGLGAK
jgi:hypothetical protein